jgi:hypothetical protein
LFGVNFFGKRIKKEINTKGITVKRLDFGDGDDYEAMGVKKADTGIESNPGIGSVFQNTDIIGQDPGHRTDNKFFFAAIGKADKQRIIFFGVLEFP